MTDLQTSIHRSLAQARGDFWLITDAKNIQWLTGFSGSFAWCIIGKKTGQRWFVTDSRYAEMAEQLCKKNNWLFLLFDANFAATIEPMLSGTILVEKTLQIDQLERITALLPGCTVQPHQSPIVPLRRTKTDEELSYIATAQTHVDTIFPAFLELLTHGMTETEAAWELEILLREKGKYGLSFPPIVAFGANTARAHHSPGQTPLRNNMPILIDCGVTYNGYASDMTRMAHTGTPSAVFLQNYEQLLETQEECLAVLKPGICARNVDRLARKALGEKSTFFTHSLGHGVGLDVHESPSLSQKSCAVLIAGDVITIEPGLYCSGAFGMRIEDLVVITKTGSKVLSRTQKELIILSRSHP